MDDQSLFAVQDLLPVDTRRGIHQPESGVTKDDCHRWQCPEILLVHEWELALIGRILPDADSQRIQHGCHVVVPMFEIGEGPVLQLVVINRHGISVRTGLLARPVNQNPGYAHCFVPGA